MIKKMKKYSKGSLAIFLCIAMVLSYVGINQRSYAADGDSITTDITLGASGSQTPKTINVGANAMYINQSGWNKDNGQYLYYGAYNGTPVKYRVLDRHNGTSHSIFNDGTATMTTAAGDYLLLDSDITLFNDQFDSTSPYSNDYSGSDIASYLSSGNDVNGASLFSDKEKAQIASTNLAASTQTYSTMGYVMKDYASAGKSFLLSNAEATQLYYGDNARQKAAYWRLRSARNSITSYAGYVTSTGLINYNFFVYNSCGVAPASNLNLSSVIFTSASAASKNVDLAQVSASSDNTWKVTLKDTTKTVSPGTVTRSGQTVSVPYSYTGSDVSQVSIVIISGDITSSDSSVLYYGKLADGTNTSGTGSFTMPSGLPAGYKAYVLAEDVNDWQYTDYASEPVEITIPAQTGDTTDKESYEVTFDSKDGSSVEAQSVVKGEKATEPAEPTKDGYVFDGWYTDEVYTTAYNFDDAVTASMTLYAKWATPDTKSSIDKTYIPTGDIAEGYEKDENQKNYQQSDGSTKNNFTYKSVEWIDKAAGTAKITVSTKNQVVSQKGALYAFTKCTAHNFSENIAVANIKYLVEHYGSVDLVIAEGPNKKDAVIIKGVTLTDETDIKTMLDKKISFASNMHYNMALYSAMCKYFEDENNNPAVVYTSFDSNIFDSLSAKPKTTDDIWDKLKAYKADGRYFAMGQDNTTATAQVTSANAANSIRAGLADPSVFVGMDSLTTTAAATPDFGYNQTFQSIEDAGGTITYAGVSVSDTVDSRFQIDKVTSNQTGAVITTTGNDVSVGFTNLTSTKVGEVYIEVTLKDNTDVNSINQWIESNTGNATVTYTDKDGKTQTSTVETPELYYNSPPSEKKFNITTDAVHGTIDPDCTVGDGNNKTIYYSADEGYRLKTVTVDGVEVDIANYPDSYTFTNVTDDHDIKVVYEKIPEQFDITTSVTGGTIDPSVKVDKGDNKTISYQPTEGYELKSITIDGEKVDITKYPDSYTFEDIAANHDIKVVYEKTTPPAKDKYDITTSVTGGTIDQSVTVDKGDNKTINYKPNEGYELKSITVDGVKIDITKYPDSYTFEDIAANHDIKVVYEKKADPTDSTGNTNGGKDGNTNNTPSKPKTGDEYNLIAWIALLVTAAGAAGTGIAYKRKSDK